MLESVGVPAAFVTTPGHIFPAFQIEEKVVEADPGAWKRDDLITLDDGSIWVPVEITLLDRWFVDAWAAGAAAWREHERTGTARVCWIREAWGTYAPVALGVSDIRLSPPDTLVLDARIQGEIDRFANREIATREAALKERMASNGKDLSARNALGVLYARYGVEGEADAMFRGILEQAEYYPALVNLGNLSYARGEYMDALGHYEKASTIAPDWPSIVLLLAKTHHRLENYSFAKVQYEKLVKLDPQLAERHNYLTSRDTDAARAGNAAQLAAEIRWEVEE